MSHTGLDFLPGTAAPPTELPIGVKPVQVARPMQAAAADGPADDIARITRSKRRAAWALFSGALLFLAANIVVQLVQCIQIGTGVGIGDGMSAGDGRTQTLVPQALAGYNEVHTADSVLHETALMLAWFAICVLVVWGYYALLSRLRAV